LIIVSLIKAVGTVISNAVTPSNLPVKGISNISNIALLTLEGSGMVGIPGFSKRLFETLSQEKINVIMITQASSEHSICLGIDEKDADTAKTAIDIVFENEIAGVGNVGERLVEQIKQQKQYLKDNLKIKLRVAGLSNSRHMIFDETGIDLKNWKDQLAKGEKASLQGFFENAKALNLRNSIFVDVTANADVANLYAQYLKESIGIVACNKIACSSAFNNYKELKTLSLKYNAPLLFETNVGAGLPIIDTLNNLIASGDKVNSIQAVLSGSLNFVFNNFNDTTKFHDVVKQAGAEGYTEPDPRIDLSGVDVARKILILARESGVEMNLEDIENTSFLSQSGLKSDTVDDFYQSLIADEAHYQSLYASAKANNCQLKYVAKFDNGKASVSLQEIPEGHPFYNLEGSDNIVMFYTERYPKQPMIIKGAGAGAEVTASGLFADIIRLGND